MSDAHKRTGRPVKPSTPGQRAALGLRVTSEMKAKLDAAAKASGRTQSQEAEYRLEQAFDERPLIAAIEAAYGRELGGIVVAVADAMRDVANYKPQALKAVSAAWQFDQMTAAAKAVLDAFRPAGKIETPEAFTGHGSVPEQVAVLRARIAEIAEQEREIGRTMGRRRLERLVDPERLDPARELMGESLASRAKAK